MTAATPKKDLVVLVADKTMEVAIREILDRHESLAIRRVDADVFRHEYHDSFYRRIDADVSRRPHQGSSSRRNVSPFLNTLVSTHEHCLLLFDREGCGQEYKTREELEADTEARLFKSGWGNRARVIVIDPELDVWFWSDSPHVNRVIGWQGDMSSLRSWLQKRGFPFTNRMKPCRPKEALGRALESTGKHPSSSLYSELAKKVSLNRCSDPAFLRLKGILQEWFGGG